MELNFSLVDLRGRDKYVNVIRNTYQNVCTGDAKNQSILISGVSGTGKSTMTVRALEGLKGLSPVESGVGSLFMNGSFEQMNSSSKQPYSGLVDAFSELCDQIEQMENLELNREIKEALGTDAKHFLGVVPSMGKIISNASGGDNAIDDCEANPAFSNNKRATTLGWAFERLKINFRSIFEVIGAHTTVILFLDDLQWADEAALDLIHFLQDSPSLSQFLFVGAFRSNELEEDDPVNMRLQELATHHSVNSIRLENIEQDDMNTLVSSLVRRSPEDTMPLSQALIRKTDGNLYFAMELLRSLHRSKMLHYSIANLRWEWDAEKIQSEMKLSGTVVNLVAAKLQCLSEEVKRCLQVAACLGNQFDAGIVDEIDAVWKRRRNSLEESWSMGDGSWLQSSKEKIRWEIAMDERLIDRAINPGHSVRYRFAHDRIQQAALSLLVSGHDRLLLHLRIGRFLLRQYTEPKTSEEWMLLAAVNQLNRSSELIDNHKEKVDLAGLNYEAAERVARKSAFFLAAELLRIGLGLLGDQKWEDHYELALSMAVKSAEYEYCCGHFEFCKTGVEEVIAKARCLQDKIEVYFTLISSLGVQKKGDEALAVGFSLVKELGFKFPRKVGARHILMEYFQARKLMKGRTDDELVELPEMPDKKGAYALRVLDSLTTFAWFLDEMEVFALLIIRMFKMSLQYGATPYTASAFSMFGIVLGKFFELEEAQRMGRLSVRVLERFEDAGVLQTRVTVITNTFLIHLKSPLHQLLNPLLKANELGLRTGDLTYGMLASTAYCICYYLCGLPLKVMDVDAKNFVIEMRKYNQLTGINQCVLHRQAALNLMGLSENVLRLEGEAIENIDEFLTRGNAVENARTNQVYTNLMMQLHYYMGDLANAAEMARQNLAYKDQEFPFFYATIYPYWRGLIYYALVQDGKMKYLRQARSQLRLLRKYVEKGMINSHYMLMILQAEEEATIFLKDSWMARKRSAQDELSGRDTVRDEKSKEIRKTYEEAIRVAARSGFPHAAALANERAGVFANRCRCESTSWWSGVYLKGARDGYAEWGAQVKVEQLQRVYGDIMVDEMGDLKRKSSNIMGRERFNAKNAGMHHADDLFYLSGDEGSNDGPK